MKNILILFGGKSSEHGVSVKSAHTILEKIDRNKFTPIPVGITKDGEWRFLQTGLESLKNGSWELENNNPPAYLSTEGNQANILSEDKKYKVDIFFPMLHGPLGEDGTIQGIFEFLNIPIVGPKTLCSALSMDKQKAHAIIRQAGILTPKDILLKNKEEYKNKYDDIVDLGFPCFVKPLKGGSSFGISKVDKLEDLEPAIDFAFKYDDKVLVEEMIEGNEIFCSVMGNEDLTVGALQEIELLKGFLDANKKEDLNNVKIHLPARISEEKTKEIEEIAKRIYHELGCQTYTRVDVFLTPGGKIYFNEVNTTPGFTETSAFPIDMKAIGIGIKDLISKLIGLAK